MAKTVTLTCDGSECSASASIENSTLPDGWRQLSVSIRKGNVESGSTVVHLCESCFEALEATVPYLNLE